MLIENFIYIKEIKVIIFSSLMIITTNFLCILKEFESSGNITSRKVVFSRIPSKLTVRKITTKIN